MNSVQNREGKRHIVLYFQVHQPRRLRTLRFFDIGSGASYFDHEQDKQIIQRIAEACYLPANALLLKLIKRYPQIRIAFSISGITIEQLEEYAPAALESFRKLAETRAVEFLTETYYHSLACMIPGDEFEMQILKHREKMIEHFGTASSVFRNTELIYNDAIGERISQLGFNGVLVDGIERILYGNSPHHLYQHPEISNLILFPRNYHLSDDIAFRFSKSLTVAEYISWLKAIPGKSIVHIGLDYETFGEHQKKESGIFDFLSGVLTSLARNKAFRMLTPTEAVTRLKPEAPLAIPQYISWADEERDLSAWLGNEIQRDAFDSIVRLGSDIRTIGDTQLLRLWRTLQTSDHFYYMSTKRGYDGGVHSYFSPYASPYEAFINYMNVITDFTLQVNLRKTVTAGGSTVQQLSLQNEPVS